MRSVIINRTVDKIAVKLQKSLYITTVKVGIHIAKLHSLGRHNIQGLVFMAKAHHLTQLIQIVAQIRHYA